MTSPFASYLDALGQDFWADDPELQSILAFHGLRDPQHVARLAGYGVFAARSMSAGMDASDRPGALPSVVGFGPHGEPDPMGVTVHPATHRLLAAALRAGAATEPDLLTRYGMTYLGAQPGEGGVCCPLACTDGLVRAIDALGGSDEVRAAAAHIRMQAPGGPVHAAQFVTEVQGGSDAGTNSTEARPLGDGRFALFGQKFFCSNLWAQYWAVTARPTDAAPGSRGLGLFLVPRTTPSGETNGFRVERLKDKLGTRSLPTGEITLHGAVGYPIGPLDQGLPSMVGIVLTTSRFWTGLAAVGFVRAAERIAHAYASHRIAFGGPIARFPEVADTLDRLARERRRMLATAFEVLSAWQESERDPQDASKGLRARVLVMLLKTWATRRATTLVHSAILVLGGNGIEERFSPLPRLLRDAVILETWEGPHGLLLSRSLLDLSKAGGADDPHRAAHLLLGPLCAAAAPRLGETLGAALRTDDERERARRFATWGDDLLDTIGVIAFEAAQTLPAAGPLG